jgi:hypothetical protein
MSNFHSLVLQQKKMSSGLRPAEIEIHSSEQTLTDFPTPTSPRSPIHEKHMDHKFVERTFINNIDLEHCAPKHVEQHPKRLLGMGNPAIMGNISN